MAKIFMIIGKSFSGKDTLLNNILSDKKFCEKNNIKKLVRYTTRKPRPNEVNGEDYYFITNEEYRSNFEGNSKFITSSFYTEFGLWHYITDLSSLDAHTNYIMVGDPNTLILHKGELQDELCVIYLMPPDWELMKRFGNRDDNEEYSEKKYKEIHRRFIDDFSRYNQEANIFINNCNCIFNVSSDYSILEIEKLMELYLTGFWNSTGVILSGYDQNVLMFDNNYKPDPDKSSTLDEAIKGVTHICNRDIFINTNDSLGLCINHRHAIRFNKSVFFGKE